MSDMATAYSEIEKALDSYLRMLKDLRELHQVYELTKFDQPGSAYRLCGHCKTEWPCRTMEVLGHSLNGI